MEKLKYDGRMDATPDWLLSEADVAQIDFDLERLNPATRRGRLQAAIVDALLPILMWFGRWFAPVIRIPVPSWRLFGGPKLALVTRHADVLWALEHPEIFPVHFNPEVREFAGGRSTFMLALDGPAHHCQRARISGFFTAGVYLEYIAMTSKRAARILRASGGRIDVMKDYFTRVSAEVGGAFLGVELDDPDAFADWTMAMSNANFGDYKGTAVARELAMVGAWRERGVVDRAIAQARRNPAGARGLLAYLIRPDVLGDNDDAIRSVLFGVSVALAPTITIGAGNILAYLQSDFDAFTACVDAACTGNQDRLRTLLIEAGRLRPALYPGQFRYAPRDVEVPGGLFGPRTIRAGDTVMVCTASALRDHRVFARPGRFRPDQADRHDEKGKPRAWLFFGYGDHVCLGDELAMQMMVRLFEELLKLRPEFADGADGRLRRVGPFPRQLWVTFDAPGRPRGQADLICHIPVRVRSPQAIAQLQARVRALGNPVRPDLAAALDGAGIIHFLSLTLIDETVGRHPLHSLILELRADGNDRLALAALVGAIGHELREILALAGLADRSADLVRFLARRSLAVTLRPWGVTGLHYNGSREFPVAVKARQAALAAFAKDAVDFYMRQTSGTSTRPIAAINFVRGLINGEPVTLPPRRSSHKSVRANDLELGELKTRGPCFADMLAVPSRQRLAFMDWRDTSDWDKASAYLGSGSARPAWHITLVVLAVAILLSALPMIAPVWLAGWLAGIGLGASAGLIAGLMSTIGAILILVVTALGTLLLTVALAGFLFIRTLRRQELADRPDTRDPDPDVLRAVAARENAPGHERNHITALSDTKPGWFRRLTLSLAMWGISVLVTHWFRPGFIATMGTIHFASWVRLPSSGKLLFLSNYDGSWNSYLEDFITKVPIGQTAAWTHATGFPRTRLLIREGVRDADAFKRWVRRQQRPTDAWYSRLPELTLDRIRTNTLIHDGLAHAQSDTAARQWLCHFGSAQPTDTLLEASEIQTILFRGLPSRPYGTLLLLQLPDADGARVEVFTTLLSGPEVKHPFPTLNFGEMPPGGNDDDSVAWLALSAQGLLHCGIAGDAQHLDLPSFPFAFTAGMRSRARILGDPEPNGTWWDDRQAGGGSVHAVLQMLHKTPALGTDEARAFTDWFESLGGKVLERIDSEPPNPDLPQRDHFGFRDGVSQPAIRGSFGSTRALPRDLMEPGEFILGYRGNQGHVAPSPRVPIADDPLDRLPDVTVEPASRFPAARKLQRLSPPFRDFGRNGSFVVIRQLEQDVDAFREYTNDQAALLPDLYPGLKSDVATDITADWVAAKMVGRWQDGVPLTARVGPEWRSRDDAAPPRRKGRPFREQRIPLHQADFSFGATDPRGLACPLGAHVRRVNPRDSLLPDDPEGLIVSNRHRILRRGRSYTDQRGGKPRKGLVFIGLCSDIERQFEFLQQRWIGSHSFHGLEGETDPIAGYHGEGAQFTIPTVSGPVRLKHLRNFVMPRGGGYFFLPSRAALEFLVTLQGQARPDAPTRKPADRNGPAKRP